MLGHLRCKFDSVQRSLNIVESPLEGRVTSCGAADLHSATTDL